MKTFKKMTLITLLTIIASTNSPTACTTHDAQNSAQSFMDTAINVKNQAVDFMSPVRPYIAPEIALAILALIILTGIVKLSTITLKIAIIVVLGCMAAGITFDQILKYLETISKNNPF